MIKRKTEKIEDFKIRLKEYNLKRKLRFNKRCKECKKVVGIHNKTGYCSVCVKSGSRCNLIGLKKTKEWRKKLSETKIGTKNPQWKGANVGYITLHQWVKRHKNKPEVCECCKIKKPFDLANISQKYRRDVNDFEWLCRRCHMSKDGRFKNLKNNVK